MSEYKRCPYCGGAININAVKCKYCKNFLQEEDTDSENNIAQILGAIAFIVVLICKFGVHIFSNSDFKNTATTNNSNVAQIQVKPDGVYGSYSEFERTVWDDNTNFGDVAFDCTKNGVGISLTEQLEGFFIYGVEKYQDKYPYFYKMLQDNPRIEFNILNPKWEEDSILNEKCRADIEFPNISKDTVMGNQDGELFTLENAYCSVVYSVSRQGKKYKATIFNVYCEPSYGYR